MAPPAALRLAAAALCCASAEPIRRGAWVDDQQALVQHFASPVQRQLPFPLFGNAQPRIGDQMKQAFDMAKMFVGPMLKKQFNVTVTPQSKAEAKREGQTRGNIRATAQWFLGTFGNMASEDRASIVRFIVPEILDMRRNMPSQLRSLIDNLAAIKLQDVSYQTLGATASEVVQALSASGYRNVANETAQFTPYLHLLRLLNMPKEIKEVAAVVRDMATTPGREPVQGLLDLSAMLERALDGGDFVPASALLKDVQLHGSDTWPALASDVIASFFAVSKNRTMAHMLRSGGAALSDMGRLPRSAGLDSNTTAYLKPVGGFMEGVATHLDKSELTQDNLSLRLAQLISELPSLMNGKEAALAAHIGKLATSFLCNIKTVAEVMPICGGQAWQGGPETRWGGPRKIASEPSQI